MNTAAVTHSLSPSQSLQLRAGRGAPTFPGGNCLIKPARGKAGKKTGGREKEEEAEAGKKHTIYKQNYRALEIKVVISYV